MSRRPVHAFLTGVCVLALGSLPACGENRDDSESDQPPPPSPELMLSESSVLDALPALSRALRRPIAVDPDAMARARCARISLAAPVGTPPASLLTLLSASLGPSGLQLDMQATGAVVRHTASDPVGGGCESSRPSRRLRRSAPRPSTGVDLAVRSEILQGVAQVGEFQWVMTPAARAALLEGDPPRLAERVRAIPLSTGLAVYGVRPESLPGTLGIRNGDRIQTIGGRAADMDSMAVLRSELLAAEQTEVRLTRRGQSVTLRYRVARTLPRRRWSPPPPDRPLPPRPAPR